jgi:hypothetical protein
MTDGAAHSLIGASSMSRWSACPGSVREAAKAPKNQSSRYAEEGSDAHALAAECLMLMRNPGFYIGKHLVTQGREFDVTQEMADAVQVYVDEVRGWGCAIEHLQIEQRFDLSEVHEGCFGTGDAVGWQPGTQTLIVADYKHGAGIPVNVVNNPQLQYYGLGALLASGYPARRVRLTVVQPRCEHPDGPVRSWEIDALDLLDFKADLKEFAHATTLPEAPLVPGPHCRFCPAAPLCPALVSRAQEVAKLEFSPLLSYDPLKLKFALDSCDALESKIKAVREFAYAEAEAGRLPPEVGYGLFEKQARRKWRDKDAAADALQRAGVNASVILTEPDLKTPAQIEAAIGKKEFAALEAALVAAGSPSITVKESSGHVLAPIGSKRTPAKLSAKQEFLPA